MTAENVARSEAQHLSVYCSRGPEGYRVHVHPGWMPRHLRQCLDAHGEGMALLDFEELDRYMQRAGQAFEKHVTATGSVELSASGQAAVTLSTWLSNMFSSGVR
ncbi:MAG TPA: hypothetical protein VJN18_02800 [Polyangiaceae bacterium]|nr:hypothetical protein [Polyangiaceae bacterium]